MGERIRKAWEVRVADFPPHIFYASTRGKARYHAFLQAQWAWQGLRLTDVRVWRARWADVKLPNPNAAVEALTQREREDLLHAYGADQGDPFKAGYRSYFYTADDCPVWNGMVDRGFAYRYRQDTGGTSFALTDAGKRAALSLVPEYGING